MSVICGRSVIYSGYYSLFSSINKSDRHNITGILLKVMLNTINTHQPYFAVLIRTLSVVLFISLLFYFPQIYKSKTNFPFFYHHSRYISRHFVVDVIWRLPVWNVKIRRYLASRTLQSWSNLTTILFQGKHFN